MLENDAVLNRGRIIYYHKDESFFYGSEWRTKEEKQQIIA